MYNYKAKLVKVIDGDTVDAVIDLGFHVNYEVRLRLHGIDTPELRTRDLDEKMAAFEAKDRLLEVLDSANNEFTVRTFKTGKYGRWLAEIYVKDSKNFDVNVNKLLVDEGLAEVWPATN